MDDRIRLAFNPTERIAIYTHTFDLRLKSKLRFKPCAVYKYTNSFIYKTYWQRKKRKVYVYMILMNGVKLWKSYKSPYKLNKHQTQCLITIMYGDLYRIANMYHEYRYNQIMKMYYGSDFEDCFSYFQKRLSVTEKVHIEFMKYAPAVHIEEIIDYEE